MALFRFALSYRDVEEMMAERGVTVSYESVREWSLKFGAMYTKRIRSRRGRLGDRWHLDANRGGIVIGSALPRANKLIRCL